jgi:hypothetical protein
MFTTELLAFINILPNASYWEDCFVLYFQQEKLEVSTLPVDFFKWYYHPEDKNNSHRYTCVIPNVDIFWKSIFYLYTEVLNIPFEVLQLYTVKFCMESFEHLGKMVDNIDIARINWLIKLKKSDIPCQEELVHGIQEALVSKLEETHIVSGKDAIERFREKCHKDSELQAQLLREQPKISSLPLEQTNSLD